MKKITYIVVFTLISIQVNAQGNSLYLGGSLGSSFINHTLGTAIDNATFNDLTIDKNNFAWKAYLGYKLSQNFAIEGGYRNTGKAEEKAEIPESSIKTNTISTKTKGWDVTALGKFDIAILFVFAKAGAFFYNTENQVSDLIFDENKTAFLWGIGAGVNLGGLAIRLEWEDLGTSVPESLSMLSAGVTFGF